MKANELMIGDLVSLHDKSIKVRGILDEGEVYFGDNYFFNERYVNAGVLEPIPITQEMLIINGFNGNISPHFMKFHWTTGGIPEFYDIDITVGKDQNGKWRWDCLEFRIHYWRGEILMYKKQYVHELQHALRLVGPNELADNFKL